MPKEAIFIAKSTGKSHYQPYKDHVEQKESEDKWEDAICSIYMEPPHSVVLLLCTSHEKGCQPYIFNISYKHSNFLDEFKKNMACPICRGQLNGWTIVEEAHMHLNSKERNCSLEGCEFVRNYASLRKHVRCDHPNAMPT